ncbi:MAG: rhomboid family intramembrane serine protease [Opitutae bacterium]|nr:rhomboid family intramembrane serine protease [Opitutae bacterium]
MNRPSKPTFPPSLFQGIVFVGGGVFIAVMLVIASVKGSSVPPPVLAVLGSVALAFLLGGGVMITDGRTHDHSINLPPGLTAHVQGLALAAVLVGLFMLERSLDLQKAVDLLALQKRPMSLALSPRFLSYAFVHVSPDHLVANVLALLGLAPLVCKRARPGGFWFVLVLGIVLAAAASFIFNPRASAGISGGIMALMGYLAFYSLRKDTPMGERLLVIGWCSASVIYATYAVSVDSIAHVAGMIAGFASAALLNAIRCKDRLSSVFWIAPALMVVCALWCGFRLISAF